MKLSKNFFLNGKERLDGKNGFSCLDGKNGKETEFPESRFKINFLKKNKEFINDSSQNENWKNKLNTPTQSPLPTTPSPRSLIRKRWRAKMWNRNPQNEKKNIFIVIECEGKLKKVQCEKYFIEP